MMSDKDKKNLTAISEERVINPIAVGEVQCVKNETIILFSNTRFKNKQYRLFYGIGTVYRVVKGDKQDLVYVNFGMPDNKRPRLVVVFKNHARRQILTLKRGQVCQIYGMSKTSKALVEIDGKETYVLKLGLYALAINGWYVPTMLDIKRLPENEDVSDPTEKEKDLQESLNDIWDEFMSGNGEEE